MSNNGDKRKTDNFYLVFTKGHDLKHARQRFIERIGSPAPGHFVDGAYLCLGPVPDSVIISQEPTTTEAPQTNNATQLTLI